MSGSGSTKAHAAAWIPRCSSILMANADPVAAIARTQQRLSVHHAQSFNSVVITLLQFKSHMESGAVSLKMIAQQSCHAEEQHGSLKRHKQQQQKENPASQETGFYFYMNLL
jgi:hypothetical protein